MDKDKSFYAIYKRGSLGTGTFDPRHAGLENGSKVPVPNDPENKLRK